MEKKSNFTFQENRLWYNGITMGKCKTEAIQTDLGIFRHNQAYSGIIQAYSKPW